MTTTTAMEMLSVTRTRLHLFGRSESKAKNHGAMIIAMARDNTKPRMQLQKGRILSIEAIQAVQSLKRANNPQEISHVFDSKIRRLLKRDMVAVLRELLRQNNCHLALMVFEDIRKEYKPQVSMCAEMVHVFAENGLFDYVELICSYLKSEPDVELDVEGFNSILRCLMKFELVGLVIGCYKLMRGLGFEPDRSLYRILIIGLESIGEVAFSSNIRQDAAKQFGESLEFLQEEEEMTLNS